MLVPARHERGSVTAQPLVDLVALGLELGRTLHPGPFVPCNVVAGAITRFGTEAQAAEWLPRLARGEMTAAWCLSDDGSPAVDAVGVRAAREGDTWRLDGRAHYVHGAANVSVLLVVATDVAGDVCHFLVPHPGGGLSERSLSGLDVTRRFAEVRFEGVTVPATAQLAGGFDVVDHCLAVATVLQSAESVGAADVLFDATVDYLKARAVRPHHRQFPGHQAPGRRSADPTGGHARRHVLRRAGLGRRAWTTPPRPSPPRAPTSTTRSPHLCGEALQLHGGIGFTWEHDVHLFMRRAKVNQVLYGDPAPGTASGCALLRSGRHRPAGGLK